MLDITKERLNCHESPNLSAYCAFRAIMRAVGRTGMPEAYHTDLAIDADILYKTTDSLRFVMCLRKSGTRLFFPGGYENLLSEYKVFGDECHFFTYDENRLPEEYGAKEPELEACSYARACIFLLDS